MARSSKLGAGCMVLFCLPFAAVGVGMLGWMAFTLTRCVGMQSWTEVPALILRADLVSKTSSSSNGGSSTTYKVEAKYEYEYEGKTYTGTRVSIHGGSDNIGSFHQRIHRQLDEHRRSETPFRCYVNPENPSEAVLFRSLRVELLGMQALFGLVFGGVGFGLMFAGCRGVLRQRRQKQLTQEAPDAPWLWKPQWENGMVRSSNKTAMIGVIVFAVLWNAISAPVCFFVPGELAKGNKLVLIALLFPLVGLILIAVAIYQIARYLKYGDSVFEMSAVPGVLGGPLEGLVRTRVNIEPEDGFELTISCINRVTTRSRSGGKSHSRTSERILWQDARRVRHELLERDPSRSAIPVRFALPYDQPPASTESSDNEIIWRLEVKAAVPGVDYDARFEIPVFRTEASREDFQLLDDGDVTADAPDVTAELQRLKARVTPLASGGLRVVFPMFRNKGSAIGALVVWVIWTAICVALYKSSAPRVFPIVFGLFDVLIFLGVLYSWFHTSRFEVNHQALVMAGGLFGIGGEKRIPGRQVQKFSTRQTLQSGSKVYHSIYVHTTDGKKHCLVRNIDNLAAGKLLIRELERLLDVQ